MRPNLPSSPPSSLSRRSFVAAAVAGSAAALVTPVAAHADEQRGDTVARAARPQAPECLADLLPDGP